MRASRSFRCSAAAATLFATTSTSICATLLELGLTLLAMEDTVVIPLSPPNKRKFLYNETYKHNWLDVSDFATKTREIQILQRSSPPRVPSTLRSGDVQRSTPARRHVLPAVALYSAIKPCVP